MPDKDHRRSARHCPLCRGRTMRIGRNERDMRLPDADHWRRYCCQAPACGWQGLRPTSRRRRHHLDLVEGVPVAVRLGVAVLALLIIAGLTWGAFQMLPPFFEP